MEEQHQEKCEALTKAGTPCQAAPMKGQRLCAAHGGKLPAFTPEQARAAAERSAQVRADKAARRKMSAKDVMRAKLEENAERLLDAAIEASLKKGDHRLLMAMYEHAYGRAVQQVADVTEETTLKALSELSAEELAAKKAQIRRRLELAGRLAPQLDQPAGPDHLH